MKYYKVLISVFSAVLNDNYIADYDNIEYATREDAQRVINSASKEERERLFIREYYASKEFG